MKYWRVEELKEKVICADCVGEEYLSAEIDHHGSVRVCDHCGESGKSYPLEEMAERIEQAFTFSARTFRACSSLCAGVFPAHGGERRSATDGSRRIGCGSRFSAMDG